MKKYLSGICICVLVICLLSGCGAAANDANGSDSLSASKPENMDTGWTDQESDLDQSTTDDAGFGTSNLSAALQTEKMVYTGYVDIETTTFDQAVEQIYTLLEQHEAYIESSDITGTRYIEDYYGYQTYRTASFTIRVPADSLEQMESNLESLGYIISLQNNMDNVTTQFYDTQTRLESYQAEAARLTEMLESAASVTDMIEIEARLSEVTYQIDSLTTTLNTLQNQVDYSTLYVKIMEVEKVDPQVPATASYWERMGEGVRKSFQKIGRFFSDLLMWLVVNAPIFILILILPACVVLVLVLHNKRQKRRSKQTIEAQSTGEQK